MMVSICCKSYNRRVMICDAIEGFLSQKTNFPYEIIIADDGSNDGTQAVIKKYAADLFPEEWCQSYKLHYLRRGKLSDDCRIVAFHGRPKPHEVNDFWVKENWR